MHAMVVHRRYLIHLLGWNLHNGMEGLDLCACAMWLFIKRGLPDPQVKKKKKLNNIALSFNLSLQK